MDDTTSIGKDYLEHYGVLGMKWGVRKQPDGGRAKTGSSSDKTTGYNPKSPGTQAGQTRRERKAAGRTTKKLNKASKKADHKSAKSERYSKNLKDSDSQAIKNLKPTAYARYLTSGARTSQVTREKQLKKSAERGRKKVAKILDNIPEGYSPIYDTSTQSYTLKKR